jgi:hypothetical protein
MARVRVMELLYFLFSIIIGYYLGCGIQDVQIEKCDVFRSLQENRILQEPKKESKKKIFIAIHSTPRYLETRGDAIRSTWLNEIDPEIATVKFISGPVAGFPTLTLPGVNDYDYPPQKKTFKLLAYFYSIAHEYDWFYRVDDDIALQFDNLIQLVSKLNANDEHYIGGTGFGRDAEDFIPPGNAFCMGGSGILVSHALVRNIRPNLSSCIKNLMTEHEDVEGNGENTYNFCVMIHIK